MTAEQIIKSSTQDISDRRTELMELYGSGESAIEGSYLLEEAALIELEIKNRGYKLIWQKQDTD